MGFVDDVAKVRRQPGGARIGTVVTLSLADSVCTVLVGNGEIPAYLNDQTYNLVAVGTVVTVLPLGGTYEVISTHGGTGGSVGTVYGPELLANNGFEYGTDTPDHWSWWPWVGGNYTAARDTTAGEAVSGSARMLVTLSPGTDAPSVNVWSEAVRVDAGATYQLAVWAKASVSEPSLVVDTYLVVGDTPENTQLFTSGTGLTGATVSAPGGAYQLLTGSILVPSGVSYGRVFLRATAGATTAPVSISWDEASLKQRIVS
jgi:hypothetical protein